MTQLMNLWRSGVVWQAALAALIVSACLPPAAPRSDETPPGASVADEPEPTATSAQGPRARSSVEEAAPSVRAEGDVPRQRTPRAQPSNEPVATPSADREIPAERSLPSDAQILQVLASLHSGEIEQALLAQVRAQQPSVRAYATKLSQQHSEAKNRDDRIATNSGTPPEGTSLARLLDARYLHTLNRLKASGPGAFDALYIQAQIAQHEANLHTLTTQLIPAAAHIDLRSELTETQRTLRSHLDEARTLQSSPPPAL